AEPHEGRRRHDLRARHGVEGRRRGREPRRIARRRCHRAGDRARRPASDRHSGLPRRTRPQVSLHLAVLSVYSLGLMALGLWLGRRVRGASDFFVAGRQLGPGLIFSTMLAANIGAGSTVGATAVGFTTGIAAWWWVGSAALGSLALAFVIGPAIRREAAALDLRSVGDYLEHRYDRRVRGITSALLWIGSIAILAGQLIAIGTILDF